MKAPKLPPNHHFGYLIALVFLVLSAYCCWHSFYRWMSVWGSLSIAFIVLARIFPTCLQPLNRAWFHFGLLLSRITNPLILGVLFFLLITPIALIMKLLGRDELRLRQSNKTSYWIPRVPSDATLESFQNQY